MRRLALPLALLAVFAGAACGGPDASVPERSPLAQKWFERADASYRAGDLKDATEAADGALKAAPRDAGVRLLAARIALAKLEFAEAIRMTEGLPSVEAKAIRGRAFWYAGDLDRAADELEEVLRDPSVKDPWAHEVAKLARRGHGRHPFAITGGLVTAVEMPQAGPALVVPCELEGERILALVSTANGELMIDSATRDEPAWVNLRFGDRIEVKDVPALTHDLSGVSRQLGAPIKALLGVNLLRHMHVTFDRRGSQFVVRKDDPPAPPDASRVPLVYVRGGGMMMQASVAKGEAGKALLFIDSSQFYPLALNDALLRRSGADLAKFRAQPGAPASMRLGTLPFFRIGSLDLPEIPAMQGAPLDQYERDFDVNFGGVVGAGLLSAFRVTFGGDDGRWLWLELDPTLYQKEAAPAPAPGAPATAPAPAPSAAPAPATAPAPSAAPAPKAPASEGKGAAQ